MTPIPFTLGERIRVRVSMPLVQAGAYGTVWTEYPAIGKPPRGPF